MKLRQLLSTFCVALLGLSSVSCSKNSDSAKIKVAIITNNPEDFWNICEEGAKTAAAKEGVELIFRRPERADVGIQRDMVNDLVNQGVSGIAVSVINPVEQAESLRLVADKVNLLTMDNDAPKSNRKCYVGTDNYEAGKAVGRLVTEIMPEGGTVAIFVGEIAQANAQERFQGTLDGITGKKGTKPTELGKYKLYKNEAITDGSKPAEALNNANNALAILAETEKNICMVGLWAYNAPKCLEAAKSKGLQGKIKIVSFDEYEPTLEGINEGLIYATVVQDPYYFGYRSVEILAALARGDESKLANGPVAHRIVMKTASKDPVTGEQRLSVKEFQDDFAKKLGKTK
ncbi:MAG: substrate-binding domain-containing protein [Zavarzinella sp.]